MIKRNHRLTSDEQSDIDFEATYKFLFFQPMSNFSNEFSFIRR